MKRFLLFSLILTGLAAQAQNTNYTAFNGPYGGSPDKIISNSAGDLLAIVSSAGVYRSVDGGVTWTPSNTGLAELYLNDIYRDPVNNKIYAVGNSRFYTSSDGGVNWTTTSTAGYTNGRFIARGSNTGYLFIIGGQNLNTVYRSIDGGAKWTARFTFNGSTYTDVRDFEISADGYLYIPTYSAGIFRAAETDVSAVQYGTASGLTSPYIVSLTISGSNLYALSDQGPVKSSNGTTWTSITSTEMSQNCCYYGGKIEKDPSGNIYVFNSSKVYKTINGGTTWTSSASPLTLNNYGYVGSSYFISSTVFFVGIDGLALYKTSNSGANWTPSSNGITGLQGRQVLFTDNSRILYAGSSIGFHLSTDDGASWDLFNNGTTSKNIQGFVKTGSTIYGYGSNGLIKSTDNGGIWTEVFVGSGATPLYNMYALASNNGSTLYSFDTYNYILNTPGFGLWKSTNSGVAWARQAITGLPTTDNAGIQNEDFLLDAAGTTLYARVYDYTTSQQSLYKINTNTAAATKITTITSGNIQDAAYFNGKLYVLTADNKLRISSDGGTTWTTKTTPTGYNYLKVITDNTIYILGNEIYISTDGGDNWTNTGNLDNKNVSDIAVSAANYAYAAVYNGPVYKSTAQVVPPNAPTNLTVVSSNYNRATLYWDDNSTNESYFIIERSAGANYDSIGTYTRPDSFKQLKGNYFTGLSASTTYSFRVRAANASGKSAYSNIVTLTTPASCQSTSNIPLNRSWTGTTSNLSGVGVKTDAAVAITGTTVKGYYNISNLTIGATGAGPGNVPPAITNPTPAAIVAVQILENCGNVTIYTTTTASTAPVSVSGSTWNSATNTLVIRWRTQTRYDLREETTTFVLNSVDPVPTSPSGLTTYCNNSTSAFLSWTNTNFATEFIVQRSLTTSTGFTEIARVQPVSGSSYSNYTNTGLTTGTKYYYRILATNASGTSTPSSEVSLTVQNTLFESVQVAPQFGGNILGSAWGDFDGDSWEDLVITGGVSTEFGPLVFKNKGDGSFESMPLANVSDEVSVYGSPAAADYDNDGKIDLFITGSGIPNKLWNNKGGKVFESIQSFAHASTVYSGAFADFNNDGLLDLSYTDYNGINAKPFYLYQQNADHSFSRYELGELGSDVTITFSHSWADYDNDGDQDLLIEGGDPGYPNRLYKNNGDGTFTRQTIAAFTTDSAMTSESSTWADFDNDGDLDLFQGNFLEDNATLCDMLYQNNGDGTFTRLTTSAPAEIFDYINYDTNGSVAGDIDNDGDIDLLVTRSPNNTLYLNNGNGTFTKHTGNESVISTQSYDNSASLADYNKDGFLDLFIERSRTQPTSVLRNTKSASSNKWIEFNLVGTISNKSAIGARVTLNLPGNKKQIREVMTMTGFSASSSLIVHFGLGTTATIPSVTIRWPSGIIQTLTNVTANQLMTVTEVIPDPVIAPFTPLVTIDKGFGTTTWSISVSAAFKAVTSASFMYRKISGSSYTSLPGIYNATSNKWDFAVAETFFDGNGLEYYFTAKGASENVIREPAGTATDVTYLKYTGNNTQITPSALGFGGSVSNWKIFAIPFDLGTNNSVSIVFDELVTKEYKKDWRLLTYKNADAWGEYPGDFTGFSRGTGYFINIKAETVISLGDNLVAPANTRASLFTIPVKKGWNQIGNPYLTPVKWANVVALNTLSGTSVNLKKFLGGSYSNGTELQPFEGGFVLMENDGTLVIPFADQVAAGGRISSVTSDLSQNNWKVNLKLNQGSISSDFSGIGMDQEASLTIDDFDDINPPRFFDYTEINFAHPEHFMKNFAKDVVPTQKEYTWTFNVDSNIDGPAELNWDNSLFGENSKELLLFDVASQMTIDMRSEGSYSFHPSVSRQFRIYYGENLKDKVNPDFVGLGEPYPNPSASKTTIPFRLPGQDASYMVNVEVYDMLGKKVATLAEGNYKSGFYTTIWNPEDTGLSNGVYTIRLVVGGKDSAVLNKKVILKK